MVSDELEKLKQPTGEDDSPARTCADLLAFDPEHTSGQ